MKVQPRTYNEYLLTHDEAITVFRALEYTQHRQDKHDKAGHIAVMHVARLLEEFREALDK